MEIDLQSLVKVERIARAAGRAIMKIYARTGLDVRFKDDRSPLTAADGVAHDLIVSELAGLSPEIPCLSEEDVPAFRGVNAEGRYWLIDPLDGTKEFIKRNGEFTVNIALIAHGEPVLGVVYAPVLGAMYAAAKGSGSFKLDATGRVPIRVATHRPGMPWRVVGSRSHAGDSLEVLLQRLGAHELVCMGSSLKLCLVAEGRADVYPRLGQTSLWDTAAAQCILEQAGGKVVQLSGVPLTYGDASALLNPFFIAHGTSGMDWPKLFADILPSDQH
ncbi:MAG: 3'(2'),5'-bisphosphate nucleotidase CysQ [Pseudomonadota bacterium]